MELKVFDEVLEDTKEPIKVFHLTTKKAWVHGFLHKETLCIHHITSNKGIKGAMNILTKRFKTNKFRLLMVINPNLKNKIKGKVVMIPPEENSFGEWVEEIHGEWESE